MRKHLEKHPKCDQSLHKNVSVFACGDSFQVRLRPAGYDRSWAHVAKGMALAVFSDSIKRKGNKGNANTAYHGVI